MGSIAIHLESLTYLVEIKEQLDVIDMNGKQLATLDVDLQPVEPKGQFWTYRVITKKGFIWYLKNYLTAQSKNISASFQGIWPLSIL